MEIMVTTISIKEEMKQDGQILLTYHIEYPEFKGSTYQMSLAVINKHFKAMAQSYQKQIKNEWFPAAAEQYWDSTEIGAPVRPFAMSSVYQITDLNPRIISLYFDQYEYTGGAHGTTTRHSQTWNVPACRMIRLSEWFDCEKNAREVILHRVKEQMEADPAPYFEDYEKLVEDTFRLENFYCTPRGIVVYFQPYDIAPYSSGIREFLIPYSSCICDPKSIALV